MNEDQGVEIAAIEYALYRSQIERRLPFGRRYRPGRRQIAAIADRSNPAILRDHQEMQRHRYGRRDIERFQRDPAVREVAAFSSRMHLVPIRGKKGRQRL
ncbi:MAG: hypothetical protein JSS22_00375, partial [Proteobacteria bacterium]|nr:hypothetical protein [Pseudomonadota bacterium]